MQPIATSTDRAAWLAARKQHVTASDVASLLGESPYATVLDVWEAKTRELVDEDNGHMERGRDLEPIVLAKAATHFARRGYAIEPSTVLYADAIEPRLAATPDAFAMCRAGDEPGIVEAKAPFCSVDDWGDEAPLHYQIQLQAQLAVTGRRWGAIAALFLEGWTFRVYEYQAHAATIARIRSEVAAFWPYVERREMPPVPLHPRALGAVQRLFPRDGGAVVEVGADVLALARAYEEVGARANELYRRRDALKAQLCACIGEASIARFPDGSAYSWKQQTKKAHAVAESTTRVLRKLKATKERV